VLGAADHLGLPDRIRSPRILEQAQLELQPQDPPDRAVDLGLVEPALRDCLLRAKNCGVILILLTQAMEGSGEWPAAYVALSLTAVCWSAKCFSPRRASVS
jgi:hypothetical protein